MRLAAIALAIGLFAVPGAGAAPNAELTRYPYLTDLVASSVTVNWATVRDESVATVRWGSVSGSCTANSALASRTAITVNGVPQYQWRATITGLVPSGEYCYRVFLDDTDLLASDPAPTFRAQVPAGSDESFSFVVFGDWGKVDADGTNAHQANVISQIASSDARFAVTTGDVPYNNNQPLGSSTDTHYGDLTYPLSAVFGSAGWPVAGKSIPIFVAPGNHGRNSSFLRTWPQPGAVAASGGRYEMETYCCLNGTTSASYPSAWYAFTAGRTRFYVLDTSWSGNVGTANSYKNDYDYHWRPESDEYQWLKHDLEAHSEGVKLAFFHYPPWSDNATETSDTYLRGAGSLEGLLARNGVKLVFNGHAHIYERNRPSAHGLISHLTGGGGATLQPIGAAGCSYSAYGIGWSNSRDRGSSCGDAPVPVSIDRVYHFLKVSVNGSKVTVAPTDEHGRTFDVQTYNLETPPPPPPAAPKRLAATASSPWHVRLRWRPSQSTDAVAYRLYRNGKLRATTRSTSFLDRTRPRRRYVYEVRALGGSGAVSQPSNRERVFLGSRGRDVLRGSPRNEAIFAFDGDDLVTGRAGQDRIYGGRQHDRLYGGYGADLISGGYGRDHLHSRDGRPDTVRGGPGRDTAVADSSDTILSIENRR